MKKQVSLFLCAVFFIAILAGCAPASDAPDEGGARDDVNIYVEGVWTSIDPHGVGSTQYTNMYLTNQLYESLVYVNDAGEIEPILATEWSMSDDGLVYTFTLRENVKFHDGETMTVEDVVYSYERAMGEAPLETYYDPIEKVEAGSDGTFVITLKAPFAPFVSYLENIHIVSQSFAEANELLTEASGTGPYKLVSIEMNTECKMTRHDDYWREPAAIKDATFKVITEATTALIAFESGDLDFMFFMNVSGFPDIRDSGNYTTTVTSTYHTAHILLNNQVEPLNDPLVRQALAHATDREKIIAIAYEGLADPTYLMANTGTFGVSDENFYNPYPYDLEKAKELLAQAGYPDGLVLGEMTVIGGTYHEKYAQVWQEDLAQIGVTITLKSSESAVADATAHNYITCTMGNGFTSDFAYNSAHYTPDNMANYDNPEVTELFAQAGVESDSAVREELYGQIIEIIHADCPNIPLFNKQVPWAWNKNLNAEPHVNSGHPYYVYEMSWN